MRPNLRHLKLGLAARIRLLEVLIAVGAGVVLGRMVPLPEPRGPITLPPVVVSAMASNPAVVAEVPAAEVAPADSLAAWVANAGEAGADRFAASFADTLPGAPMVAVALAGPAPQLDEAPRRGPVTIRITDAATGVVAVSGTGYSDSCAGAGADRPECRSPAPRRRDGACPKPGDGGRDAGPVICIRASADPQ